MVPATAQEQLSRRRPRPKVRGRKEGGRMSKHHYTEQGNNLETRTLVSGVEAITVQCVKVVIYKSYSKVHGQQNILKKLNSYHIVVL